MLLRGLSAARLELPRDCSFVTYGGSEWAAACRSAISTVNMDLYAVVADMTRRIIAGLGDSAESSGEIPSHRSSCAVKARNPFPAAFPGYDDKPPGRRSHDRKA
jgi:DNA-binding LacI/PurR family transcriptional regulator